MADYVPIKEAARRLGVKPKDIRRRIKDGELDGFVRLPRVDESGLPVRSTDGVAPADTGARDAQSRRLEETVLVLQSELNARRREVDELRVLLREIKDNLPAAAGTAVPETDQPVASGARPDAAGSGGGAGAGAGPSESVIDWNAYDAESEQLRATMSRLESLLEQLESVEDEEPEPEPVTAPELQREPAPIPTPAPAATPTSEPEKPTPGGAPAAAAQPARAIAPPVETTPAARPAPRMSRATDRPAPAAAATGTDEVPLGDALNRRREKMGVSREALSAFSRLSWGFITEVESGRRRDPRSRQRLAKALDAWQKRLNEEKKAS